MYHDDHDNNRHYSDVELVPPPQGIPRGFHAPSDPRWSTPEPYELSNSTRNSGVGTPDYNNPSTTLLDPASNRYYTHERERERFVAAQSPGDKEMYASGVSSPPGLVSSKYGRRRGFGGTKRRRGALGCLVLLLLVFVAVFVPVYFKVIKPNRNSNKAASGGTSGSSDSDPSGSNPQSPTGAITGGDGSTVTTSSGESFTYNNKFGGTWYHDPSNPFANNAQAQADTPPLNASWTWGRDEIRGVNLGGWFVIEPFITPAFFQKYTDATDEWTLSEAMRADTAPGGGIGQLEEHYKTFITEKDFAEMAGAGLNWCRLPIPYWAIDTWPGEPFLAKTAWTYILQAFQWARKYGIRINLDLHTAPGSQNGYNHSGKGGGDQHINFMSGVMGVANAQRMLGYIRVIAEFISQPEWKDVVPVFGIINEARVAVIGKDEMTSFYIEAHDMIRGITGIGEGNGAYISIHDGFVGMSNWTGFLQGSDRIILDTHPYFAFDGQANNEPLPSQPAKACNAWAVAFNSSQHNFGITIAGEFSNGMNDCGLFLLGPAATSTSYERNGGDCDDWTVWENWSDSTKNGIKNFALASMDALHGGWFFWTWKIGNDTKSGSVRSPLWSYQLGLENGWIPLDPRNSVGKCESAGVDGSAPFSGTYSAWQTGGAGAGTIDPTSLSAFGQWPPRDIRNLIPADAPVTLLPTYTPTGPVPTLPPPTLTVVLNGATKTLDAGDGWADASDTAGAPTTIAGCSYPDPWNAATLPVPSTVCPSAAVTAPPAI